MTGQSYTVGDVEPTASRPHMPGYGIVGPAEGTGLLPWSWAVDRLERSHDFWLATVSPEHRPHVTPVWGVWNDGGLWFSCSRQSRKARNLATNPVVVATTDDPANPVILDGPAAQVQDRDLIAAFAEWADTKYRTNYGVDFYAHPNNACFRIHVASAFGLSGDDFTGSPTRWTFPD
ncbi:MAG: pyridoxamine 5'-phosphate oxidase [Actinophytocola sp.]|nr:pyridoxamine 5'-phosphate oxidase [Actinophytocola sp.]